jgi:hypothetical protein
MFSFAVCASWPHGSSARETLCRIGISGFFRAALWIQPSPNLPKKARLKKWCRHCQRKSDRHSSKSMKSTIVYCVTTIEEAISALQSQENSPGNHNLWGRDICFTEAAPQPQKDEEERGIVLEAEIDLGESINAQSLDDIDEDDEDEFDSVVLERDWAEPEYIVFDPERVRSIKLHDSLPYVCTETLQISADGLQGPGMSPGKSIVRVIGIWPHDVPFPVRVGWSPNEPLGWTSPESLTLA